VPLDAESAIIRHMIDPAQSRATRGLLNWNQDVLAERANIGVATVRKFENAVHTLHRNNMSAVVRAFEDAGVEFIERNKKGGPGVRLRE
jgi:hypothetical protein